MSRWTGLLRVRPEAARIVPANETACALEGAPWLGSRGSAIGLTRGCVNNHAALLCARSCGLLRTDLARAALTNFASRRFMAKELKLSHVLFLDPKPNSFDVMEFPLHTLLVFA